MNFWHEYSKIDIKHTLLFSCAYLMHSVQDYISISLELLGQATIVSEDERNRIQRNLQNVLKVGQLCSANISLWFFLNSESYASEFWKNSIDDEFYCLFFGISK